MERLSAAMLVITAVSAACDHRSRVTSCQSDLSGVWTTDTAARWMILDQGPASLEVYPLFTDGGASGGVTAAPRVIDLHREGTGLAGLIKKRYMHGDHTCGASVPVQVTSCAEDTLELVLVELPELRTIVIPEGQVREELFGVKAPCSSAPPAAAHLEHWHRE